ncbi:MAG: DUF58 domain-containing protein [Gemmobacter sp.]
MADPTEPPLSPDRLRSLRLGLRKTVPSHSLGAHLRRKQGQSLQFRDYRLYQRGDDIRAVDWRASLRRGNADDLIVKTFEAEERMTLALVVDVRPAMRLPTPAPKLVYALWALRCLAQVAAEAGDAVILATLFGPQDGAPLRLRGRAVPAAATRFARRVWDATPPSLGAEPVAQVDALVARLKPASAVVLLSDLLFADAPGAVTRLALAGQASRREFFVMEMDTLAMEWAALRKGVPARLETVEGRGFGDTPRVLDDAVFNGARAEVGRLRAARRQAWARGGLVWPAPVVWPEGLDAARMADLFAASFPGSAVFRGVAARGGV